MFHKYKQARPGLLRHPEELLPLLPSGPDGVRNPLVAQGPAIKMAERVGFEPTVWIFVHTHDFQSCSLSHSDISPKCSSLWRRERDSNPRSPEGTLRFERSSFDLSDISPNRESNSITLKPVKMQQKLTGNSFIPEYSHLSKREECN